MTVEPIKDMVVVNEMFEALAMRPKSGFLMSLYFEFALSTGLRVSDILSLKKKNIENGVVKISKTSPYRSIALNDGCRKRMEAYLMIKKKDDYIFNFGRQWVHQFLKKAADDIGIDSDKVSTHTTRKTAGWFFYLDSGKDLVKTQKFLGHRSPKDTLMYLMINDDEVNQALIHRN